MIARIGAVITLLVVVTSSAGVAVTGAVEDPQRKQNLAGTPASLETSAREVGGLEGESSLPQIHSARVDGFEVVTDLYFPEGRTAVVVVTDSKDEEVGRSPVVGGRPNMTVDDLRIAVEPRYDATKGMTVYLYKDRDGDGEYDTPYRNSEGDPITVVLEEGQPTTTEMDSDGGGLINPVLFPRADPLFILTGAIAMLALLSLGAFVYERVH
jgi:hypothetical protein